ncbi:s1 RNA binding domain-containing protein, partial [Lacticaseibacillus rhamnosus MTCC 5462]
ARLPIPISDPAVIKQVFGISKGAFKRALGHLLKAGLIKEEAGYTVLLDSNSQPSQEA